ncbi:hypothetical protein TNCT_368941 [Trichonephila clavata]|uniref:Uncharacterized protein n=1 Tax=Trichonephila clavata TaxID=2740835 RepID=A0A8X6K7T7_TRICU|nr:hypothetical protein TNCT_368941 [Trichonephila clavata]
MFGKADLISAAHEGNGKLYEASRICPYSLMIMWFIFQHDHISTIRPRTNLSIFQEEEPEKEIEKCSLCHTHPKECACVECGAQTCKKCSKAIPSGKVCKFASALISNFLS